MDIDENKVKDFINTVDWVVTDMGFKAPEQIPECLPDWHEMLVDGLTEIRKEVD